MDKPFVRTPYNYDRHAASKESAVRMVDRDGVLIPSKTVQSEKDNCDINVIVKRFTKTGQLPHASVRVPMQGDFTGVSDFQSAMNAVRASQEAFMAMPASVRSRFANNPDEFVRYCMERDSNGKLVNVQEMRKMGLAVPEEVVLESEPQRVVVVNAENDRGQERTGGTATGGSSSASGKK